MGVRWAGQPSRALHHRPSAVGSAFIPIASRGAVLVHLETRSATAASFSRSISRKGPASASAPEVLGTTSFTESPVALRLCSRDGRNWMPGPGRGSSQPWQSPSREDPRWHRLYVAAAFPPLPLGCCSTPPPHLVFLPPGTQRAFIFPGSAWMTKPVDYLFFFMRHPPASREFPHRGGIWGSCPRCGSPMLTLFPNHTLSLETPLNLAGKNQVGLKIPRLFALCFFWRLWIVFKRFPTNVGVRNTSLTCELRSPPLTCLQQPGLGRKTWSALGAQC